MGARRHATMGGVDSPMRILPERWTIDFWPMRLIVSVYLVTTGLLIAGAIMLAGLAAQAAAVLAAAAAERVFGALFVVRQAGAQAGPAHISIAPYLAGAGAMALFFLVATGLMWTRMRGHWIAAAAAALAGGAAWWLLAYAALAQPEHQPTLGSALVFVAMTAVVTLGVLAATLQRAPKAG
jgi:hypothetical protein